MSAARLAKSAIKIPKYIERGPTDILKALASTIKYIPKEPEPLLHDDPYLLPTKQTNKRYYMLSRLSGKKTAKYLLNKHPELFFRDDAEPKIEAFCPREEFNSEMEFTEEDIKWCIDNYDPVNGIIAYESLEAKGVKISDETLLKFFELICFTNGENCMDWLDYERHRFVYSGAPLTNQAWRTSDLVSKIFNQIKDDLDAPRVYSAMISALSRFKEHSAAKKVFENFKEIHPDKALYNSAYDGLMRSVQCLTGSVSASNEAITEIINHMEANLVKPDLAIFNSLLYCYFHFVTSEETCQKSFALLNDMISLNIQPSLATFAVVIQIIGKYKGGRVYGELIPEILAYIESSDDIFQVRDDRDVSFLAQTMDVIKRRTNSLALAKKLHRIYLRQPHLFLNVATRANYLNDYFKLILTTDSLENILLFYENYVPTSFRPRHDCYDILAEALDLYSAPEEVVKKIGQDVVEFNLVTKLKNDAIFRKDPTYVEAFERQLLQN